ncbi:putative ubiquitin-conjugating enzyme E2 26 [Hordeum vulgare]|nr:putative ubiquitin-conjugating enzyme E2 26 [Hordeum vulgare]
MFATMATTNDPKVLKTSGLACQKLIDIHDHYKVWGNKKDKDSHADLTVDIIDPYYSDMKAECEKNKLVQHKAWVKRLDEYHIQTVSKEA